MKFFANLKGKIYKLIKNSTASSWQYILDIALLTCDISAQMDKSPNPAATAPDRVKPARERVACTLGQHYGKPVFIRIIKEERVLELWVKTDAWERIKLYPILSMSGGPGPKTAEGDLQAPEGFYLVTPRSLNPRSKYHLAFNVGYPNAYDRHLGRTGSFIMVHGGESSSGCFAMGDSAIEEIYTMVNEAFLAGAAHVPVQIYPFAMTLERMTTELRNEHIDFWRHLQSGWEYTEQHLAPYPDSDNT